jgi:hypothetical protein
VSTEARAPDAAERSVHPRFLRPAIRWVRHWAWAVLVVADIGLLMWAAMAAAAPELLVGPGSLTILPAGYQGFTGGSWRALVASSPRTAEYLTLLFRMFGLYGVAFSLLAIAIAATAFRRGERWAWWALLVGNTVTFVGAMTYDQIARAVGPFESSEYVGLAAIFVSLAVHRGAADASGRDALWPPCAQEPASVCRQNEGEVLSVISPASVSSPRGVRRLFPSAEHSGAWPVRK